MITKVVNIHYFDIGIHNLNIVPNSLDVFLACIFRFDHDEIGQ